MRRSGTKNAVLDERMSARTVELESERWTKHRAEYAIRDYDEENEKCH